MPSPSDVIEAAPLAAVASARSADTVRRRARRDRITVVALAAVVVLLALVAVGAGQLAVPIGRVVEILTHDAAALLGLDSGIPASWTRGEQAAVSLIRAPRALLAILVGAALAVSGAVLQALFRNPLVSPDVIGVSSAASFGGVLAIAVGAGGVALMSGAFVTGLLAALLVMLLGRLRTSSPVLTIVLGGIVVSAFFNALVSLVTYVADPYTTLPSITFWLMGSFVAATWDKVLLAAVPIAIGLIVVLALRWRINVLALGDDEALALGVRPARLRGILIIAVSLLTAATVAVCGVIGWVGLVIPHLVRLVIGPDHRVLLPASALLGGAYVLAVDTLARTVTTAELPVGILTAIIGAPVFVIVLVRRTREGRALA
ncbi:FecCD family ABC transporter permease [Microbacterium rhizophilus]|uniref:FecCD family ABC transporter permease n=1 Tax=Microbacterium rhizophilus TaxID=3138934 RepID=UPI0031EF1600